MGRYWAHDNVRLYRSADTLLWRLSIDYNMDVQYKVASWL